MFFFFFKIVFLCFQFCDSCICNKSAPNSLPIHTGREIQKQIYCNRNRGGRDLQSRAESPITKNKKNHLLRNENTKANSLHRRICEGGDRNA